MTQPTENIYTIKGIEIEAESEDKAIDKLMNALGMNGDRELYNILKINIKLKE